MVTIGSLMNNPINSQSQSQIVPDLKVFQKNALNFFQKKFTEDQDKMAEHFYPFSHFSDFLQADLADEKTPSENLKKNSNQFPLQIFKHFLDLFQENPVHQLIFSRINITKHHQFLFNQHQVVDAEIKNINENGNQKQELAELITLSPNVQVDLLISDQQEALGQNNYFFYLEENSSINIICDYSLQEKNQDLKLSTEMFFILKEGAQVKFSSLNFKNLKQRFAVNVKIIGKNANFDFSALHLLNHHDRSSLNLFVDHLSEGSNSNQYIQSIVADQATFIFQGKIFIGKDCSKTDARQLSRHYLLSTKAKAYSLPQIDVYNDDVSCAHGSSVGLQNQEELFYLTSRGISPLRAGQLMLLTLAAPLKNHMSNHFAAKTIIQNLELKLSEFNSK